MLLLIGIFVLVATGVSLAGVLLFGRTADECATTERLRELSQGPNNAPNPVKTASFKPLRDIWLSLFARLNLRVNLKVPLLQAGFIHPSAPAIYVGVKTCLVLVFSIAGAIASFWLAWVPPFRAIPGWGVTLIFALLGCNIGLFAPLWWLLNQVYARQRRIRTALPDALDMLVLCLESGASISAAFQRVTDELQVVHPALGLEMTIVQQGISLGLSPAEAIKKMAERCGLPDLHDLATVLMQSERYGASISKALRLYSDGIRQQRFQEAEERGQKASVMILFPMLVCIFPAIFVVVLAPATTQLSRLFNR